MDGKLTLLHFVEDIISTSYPGVSGFESEISHVDAAARGMYDDSTDGVWYKIDCHSSIDLRHHCKQYLLSSL